LNKEVVVVKPFYQSHSERIRSMREARSLLRLSGSASSLFGGLLEGRLGLHSGEEVEAGMAVTNASDGSTGLSVLDKGTSDRSVDLELFAEDASCNAEDFCHFLRDLFVALLIEEDIVVELVLDLGLGPAILLLLCSALGFGGLSTF
jgi:hypothetical protein